MSTPLDIGILLTGTLPETVVAAGGEYDYHFRQLLGPLDPDLRFETVDIVGGAGFPDPASKDGWLITGSRHGAYDDLPWIPEMRDFIRAVMAEKVPLVGVCFGHQIMADALGGRNEKSAKGWGLGVQSYDTLVSAGWMPETLKDGWNAFALHQDQVVVPPPGATILASSAFCPYAALAYGDPERPTAISIQPHPEYTPDLLERMIDARLSKTVPADIVERARESAGTAQQGRDWGRAIVNYFRSGL